MSLSPHLPLSLQHCSTASFYTPRDGHTVPQQDLDRHESTNRSVPVINTKFSLSLYLAVINKLTGECQNRCQSRHLSPRLVWYWQIVMVCVLAVLEMYSGHLWLATVVTQLLPDYRAVNTTPVPSTQPTTQWMTMKRKRNIAYNMEILILVGLKYATLFCG